MSYNPQGDRPMMSGMAAHSRLTRKQRQALGFAVAVVAAGMVMGFWSSFLTLYDAAQSQGWPYPARLPLSVDSGIVAYVVADHLAVAVGSRSRWLHLVALGLAAFTVWANAVLGRGTGVWRIVDAAMPALWVLGVEALRFLWQRMHEDPAAKPARIPPGRWLAAPLATGALRRRMWLTAETSYPRAIALEDARLHARDLLRAAGETDPAPVIPAALRRAVRSGRLPADVVAAVDRGMTFGGATQWEPAVATWVTSQLTLPDRLSAQLQATRQEIAREASPVPAEAPLLEPAAEAPAAAPRSASAKPPGSALQRVRRMGGRKASDEDVREAIRELFADGKPVTKYRVVKELRGPKGGIGDDKAGRLLAEVQAERPPLAAVR